MPTFKKRTILELAEMDLKIAGILDQSNAGPVFDAHRPQLVEMFRGQLQQGRERLHSFHREGASGRHVARSHAYLMDALLRRLFLLVKAEDGSSARNARGGQPAKPQPWLKRLAQMIESRRRRKTTTEQFCLVATGGYGRGELSPYSDIDLLFLLPDDTHPKFAVQVEQMLYFMWDLGLEVGHAVRNVQECVDLARQELQILTSLLESRFLAGNKQLFKRYQTTLFEKVLLDDPAAFQRAKLVEQRQRHERFGNSMFYLEPNLKENPGGLRDIHTFVWISKYRYRVKRMKDLVTMKIITEEEYRTFIQCREFLHRVRNALHFRVGRKDDRLTFQNQLEIARELGYKDRENMRGVEQFMRRYYRVVKQVGNLTQILLQKYQEEQYDVTEGEHELLEDVFHLVGDKVAVTHDEAFQENPVRLMRLFEVATIYQKSIHPDTMRLVTRNLCLVNRAFRTDPDVCRIFLELLSGRMSVGWVLREMNACQFLGRFIPEFGRIIGQSQHDLFHVYTVDEHTLMAVEALRHIRSGHLQEEMPISTELMRKMRNPVVLYLAVLFHDIAKGRGGRHEIQGAALAFQIASRLGLPEWEIQQVVWLVENHLIFSRTAFRRDINDPQTVIQFSRMVGNTTNLDLLLLLTVADIRAVGPGVWNQWKASLLRRLYLLSTEYLNRGLFPADELARQATQKKAAVLELLGPYFPEEAVQQYLDRFYPDYFAGHDAEDIAEHFSALSGRFDQPLAVALLPNPHADSTTLLIHTPDHPGLFAEISGALATQSANILFANGTTTRDGVALDIFVIQDVREQAIKGEKQLARIEEALREVLSGKKRLERLLPESRTHVSRYSAFHIEPAIEWDNDFSESHTVLEITALDRLGLLYAISREIQENQVQISTAKIATYGERAVDVFYLKDIFGLKLGKAKIQQLTKGLMNTLQALEAGATPQKPAKAAADA
ncbi:MAG: [protein-PII] uridylyltransferase [Magnetococcales bacterium]|nr:[protein-PII] uridylyltransferase [Magnetococcales bacterium]